MGAFVGGEDFGGSFVFHGFSMDVITVVIVEDQEFVAARAGRRDEAAGLIGENLARVGHAGGEAKMRAPEGGLREKALLSGSAVLEASCWSGWVERWFFLDWSRWPLIVDTEWGGFPDESGIKT
jgi:hypothetical protein